jgi:hypothetical protein
MVYFEDLLDVGGGERWKLELEPCFEVAIGYDCGRYEECAFVGVVANEEGLAIDSLTGQGGARARRDEGFICDGEKCPGSIGSCCSYGSVGLLQY